MSARRLQAVPDTPRRFVIAVRVSQVRDRSGEAFHSPELQVREAGRAIEAVGGVLATDLGEGGVFYDLDVSGAVLPAARPGMGAAMQAVREGLAQGIATYDVSRFSRDTAGGLRALEDVAAMGGQVISAAETLNLDTPSGLFTTTVMLAAARMKRDETAKRWREVHERRHEQGRFHGKVPLGYLIEAGQAVPDPVLGPLITWAFESYLAGTTSQQEIARRLTQARGRLVRQGVVSNLLRNPFHAGKVMYQRQRRPGVHTPLVTEGTFEAVQRKLVRELHDAPRTRVPLTAVIGLVVCRVCERPVHRRGRGAAGEDGTLRPRLRCSTAGCVGVGAPFVSDVEQALRQKAVTLTADLTDQSPAMLARRALAQRQDTDRGGLQAERTRLEGQLDTAAEKLAAEVLDDATYRRLAERLRGRLEEIDGRLAVMQEPAPVRPVAELRQLGRTVDLLWDRMEPRERRAALRALFDSVLLGKAAYRGQPVADRLSFPEYEE